MNKYNENQKEPINLIFETDISSCIDDALALAMLHSLVSRGKCKLLGVSASSRSPYSVVFADIINTFYGHGNVPVGYIQDCMEDYDGMFVRQISERMENEKFKHARTIHSISDYFESVSLLRKLLAAASDNSVVIISAGKLTNLSCLLMSGPDEYSNLGGHDLVSKKVKFTASMCGVFLSEMYKVHGSNYVEFNIAEDVASGRYFIQNWPGEIVFSGREIGEAILYPVDSILNDFRWTEVHPVVDAYKLFRTMPYETETWDLSVVLHVFYPGQYFDLSEKGTVYTDEIGKTLFKVDPSGKHRHLVINKKKVPLAQKKSAELCSQPVQKSV
jgi:hypothetical protein